MGHILSWSLKSKSYINIYVGKVTHTKNHTEPQKGHEETKEVSLRNLAKLFPFKSIKVLPGQFGSIKTMMESTIMECTHTIGRSSQNFKIGIKYKGIKSILKMCFFLCVFTAFEQNVNASVNAAAQWG